MRIVLIASILSAAVGASAGGNDSAEAAILIHANNQAIRSGEILTIRTSSRTIEFEDGKSYSTNTLVAVFRPGRDRMDFLIRHEGIDRREFTLINGKSGTQRRISDIPVLSPDHASYLVASPFSELNYNSGGLIILNSSDFSDSEVIQLDKNVHASEGVPFIAGVSEVKWVTPDLILFTEQSIDRPGHYLRPRRLKLERHSGKWSKPLNAK